MFYHPEVTGDPVEMTLPGCEAPCPLEQWARLTKNLTLDTETWTRECRLDKSDSRTETQDFVVLILLVAIICLVFVIIPVTFTASRCQRHRDYSSI